MEKYNMYGDCKNLIFNEKRGFKVPLKPLFSGHDYPTLIISGSNGLLQR